LHASRDFTSIDTRLALASAKDSSTTDTMLIDRLIIWQRRLQDFR